MTIEEAQNIIYNKTLVRCIIWDLVDHFYIGQKNHHNGDTKDINL